MDYVLYKFKEKKIGVKEISHSSSKKDSKNLLIEIWKGSVSFKVFHFFSFLFLPITGYIYVRLVRGGKRGGGRKWGGEDNKSKMLTEKNGYNWGTFVNYSGITQK